MPVDTHDYSPLHTSSTKISVKAANSGTLGRILKRYIRFMLRSHLLLDQPLVLRHVELKAMLDTL